MLPGSIHGLVGSCSSLAKAHFSIDRGMKLLPHNQGSWSGGESSLGTLPRDNYRELAGVGEGVGLLDGASILFTFQLPPLPHEPLYWSFSLGCHVTCL